MFVSVQTAISYLNTLFLTTGASMSLDQNQVLPPVSLTDVEHDAKVTAERQPLQGMRSEIPPVRYLTT